MEIYEAGKPIGTWTAEKAGLFWEINCSITERPECLRRIFVQNGWQVEYLGIPDKNGRLKGRLPKNRMPQGITTALASQKPKGRWLPWRGEVDGVQVENALILPTEEGIELALFPEDTLKFPAWADRIEIESILDREMAVLFLDRDGRLPARNIETGGTTDETMDRSDFGVGLPDDSAACDSSGGAGDEEQGRQTHCPDI